jgi:sialic acid synthase SpsE/spore coat polysaccharide biosynthesis protein SpsF (cytidylyltransferase family)/glycosyltransferase involved in cell wall biosynthesis
MVEIIAEVANAHEGDPNRAIDIALRAVGAGAHAVKFQIYFGADLLTEDHPRFGHFCKQSFSREDWIKIVTTVKKSGTKVYADVFGLEALDMALECDVDGLKIHSSDLSNTILSQSCARAGLPIFLAVGGSTLREITDAICDIRSINSQQKIIILFGYQAYPTKIERNSISKIDILKRTFGNEVDYGFMDHTDGEIDEALTLPSLALAFGCTYIEKHVTDNRALKGVDYYSSLEDVQFEKFVSHCISAEKYLGSMTYDMCADELHYRNTVKKIWVANKDLEEGHFLDDEDLVMKRSPNSGVQDMTRLIGKKLIKSIARDAPITRLDVQVKVLAVVVARSKSTRLPGKATLPIASVGALEHLFRRLDFAKAQHSITSLAFCTTKDASDDELAKLASEFGVQVFRGDVDNVLKRMSLAFEAFHDHDLVLRITGDDILCDPEYLAKTVNYHLATGADYTDAKALPSGTEVEVFDASVLRYILSHALDTSGTEYLTNYITDNQHLFSCHSLPVTSEHSVKARLTLDTLEDYSVIGQMVKTFAEIGKEFDYTMDDIADYFTKNPSELSKNQEIIQRKIPLQFDTKIAISKNVLKPLVTVYIVNFNYAKYLERSIESVLSQTFQNIQILIIDDGSSDDSHRILDYYENVYGIEVVRNTNKGLTASNNSALRLARGKYITRLDADDFFHEDAIRQLVSPLEKNVSVVAVFPDYAVVDQEGNVLHYESRNDFKKDVDLFDSPAHGACTLIRLEMLKEVGGYNEDYLCQDGWDAWLKLLKFGSVQNISLPLFFYRQHGENLTRDKRRLYRTRSIILADHNRLINKSQLSSLVIIPVRDSSSQPLCLREFRGTNLLSIAIKQALEAERVSAVIVSTDNPAVIKTLSALDLDIVIHDRRESSVRLDREIDSVVVSVMALDKISKLQFDCISVVNYEYPFRDRYVIDQSVDILQAFDADSSMTVIPLNHNLYQNSGKGLQPDSKNTNLRHERESRFAELGGVHTVMASRFNANKRIHQDRVATIEIDEQSAFKVESDFLLALAND